MARPFKQLRMEMVSQDVGAARLGNKLMLGHASVSDRMCARTPWRIDEMYAIMDLLRWPYERMHELFPKDGQNEPGCFRGKRE